MEAVRQYWTPQFLEYDALKQQLIHHTVYYRDDLVLMNQFLRCYNAVHVQMCKILGASMRNEAGPVPVCQQLLDCQDDIASILSEAHVRTPQRSWKTLKRASSALQQRTGCV